MSVTKTQMDRWQPDQLKLVGIGNMADSIVSESEAANRLFDLPHSDWDGNARGAATERASNESAWARRVAAKVTDLETAMTNAAGAISPAKDAVNAALGFAGDNDCHLISPTDPSWKMKYTAPADADELSPDAIATREREMTDYVMIRVNALDTTVTDHATHIRSALDGLRDLTPSNLGLSAQDGRRDANLRDDGWTDAELRQVGDNLRAAGLSDDQIRRLMNGEHLTDVPEGAQEYLHQFYNNLSAKELFDLQSKFDDLNSTAGKEYSKALGNGLLQLSNENIGSTGGFNHLPQWVQDWTSNRESSQDNRERISTRDVPIGRLLTGTKSVPGERFGTELIRKSSEGAGRTQDGSGITNPGAMYGGSKPYEETIQSLLDAGTRNTASSAAIMSGQYSDGTDLADYKRDDSVGYLARHEWSDDGQTVAKLLNWIDDYGNSEDPTKVKLADRAFQGLYDYSTNTDADGTNNFKELMDIGDNKDGVGKVNPHLADAMRQAANPYLNILGGYPGEDDPHTSFNPGSDPAELQRRTARLFTLISSDDYAGPPDLSHSDGTGAGADLYRDLLQNSQENGQKAQQGLSIDPNSTGTQGLSKVSTNLLALGRAGLFGAQYDLQIDANKVADDENAAMERTQGMIDIASKGVGYLPFGDVAVDAADIIIPHFMEPEVAPDIPLNLNPSSEGGPFNSADGDRAYFIYGALGAEGTPPAEDHPEWYRDGKLKPLEEIVTNFNLDENGQVELKEDGTPKRTDGQTALSDTIEAMQRHVDAHSPQFRASQESGEMAGTQQAGREFDPTDPDAYTDSVLNGDVEDE